MPRTRNNATNVNVVTVAETLIVATPGITVNAGNVQDIFGVVDITPGTAATAILVQVELGAVAGGGQISLVQAACTAGTRIVIPIATFDSRAVDVAGQQYALTVQQVAATGNATVNRSTLAIYY